MFEKKNKILPTVLPSGFCNFLASYSHVVSDYWGHFLHRHMWVLLSLLFVYLTNDLYQVYCLMDFLSLLDCGLGKKFCALRLWINFKWGGVAAPGFFSFWAWFPWFNFLFEFVKAYEFVFTYIWFYFLFIGYWLPFFLFFMQELLVVGCN